MLAVGANGYLCKSLRLCARPTQIVVASWLRHGRLCAEQNRVWSRMLPNRLWTITFTSHATWSVSTKLELKAHASSKWSFGDLDWSVLERRETSVWAVSCWKEW